MTADSSIRVLLLLECHSYAFFARQMWSSCRWGNSMLLLAFIVGPTLRKWMCLKIVSMLLLHVGKNESCCTEFGAEKYAVPDNNIKISLTKIVVRLLLRSRSKAASHFFVQLLRCWFKSRVRWGDRARRWEQFFVFAKGSPVGDWISSHVFGHYIVGNISD